ncbi:DNA-directed RNA polymerases I, II, and III subunit rpabc3 [Smittium culicis]|uniref:DNA-directed RNA polymerases I, II, and III subunit RPABC3 n=1 Tax=Smittium culicis TaxID=133412 RepID=A0A1R1YPL8_9FUNG|nr:DNA-directed RNA polymerases I, II, and III subunit rpabc3 [Smittium culicis]
MDNKDNLLFSDFFTVKDIDKDGKKFDRVSRIGARSENYDMELTLDVNSELYPLDHGDRFTLVLASSLALNSAQNPDKAETNWRSVVTGSDRSLADDYEYVMYGRIYRFDDSAGSKVSAFVSFGGLLMCLEGESHHLQNLSISESIYLLLRR